MISNLRRYYNDLFCDLLTKEYNESNSYLGLGNPDSKILIIGKECSTADEGFLQNTKKWREMPPETVEDWFDKPWNWQGFHPRTPFLGQLFVRERGNNHGTSNTWMAYQKFINFVLPIQDRTIEKQPLNFYDHCFLTELSCNCMPLSRKNDITRKSIAERLGTNGVLQHPFFKKFPVIVCAFYHYFDWYNDIPIIKSFDDDKLGIRYHFERMIVPVEAYNKLSAGEKEQWNAQIAYHSLRKGEFINVHTATDNEGVRHILLHTCHLTNQFTPKSDDLFMEMADIVKPYLIQ